MATNDAQVMGEGSEGVGEGSGGVGEGSVEGKHGHVLPEESERERERESERGDGSVAGGRGGSEGVLEARVGREVSMGGTTVHPIEEIEFPWWGREGRGVESPSEPDTPSRRSYMSSTDSGESGDDSGSDFELSDRDT